MSLLYMTAITYNNDTCSICLEDFAETCPGSCEITSLECGHTFHVKCIIKSLRKSNECPNCRDTDGNPKLSVQNNTNFNFIWDDDQTEYDNLLEEYNDFKNVMSNLRKNNKKMKDLIQKYKNDFKHYEQQYSFISKKYQVGLNNVANEYLKAFRTDPDFIEYNQNKNKMQQKYYLIRKKIEKELLQNLDMEPDDEMRDFIKDYVDNEIGEYYYFIIPRTIYL